MGCGGAGCQKFSEYDINGSDEHFSGHAEDNSNVVRTRRQSILVLSAKGGHLAPIASRRAADRHKLDYVKWRGYLWLGTLSVMRPTDRTS
jgi:hypothetical protein